jgi:hypothetical protein
MERRVTETDFPEYASLPNLIFAKGEKIAPVWQ